MKTTPPRIWLPAIVAVACGCELPERTNPHDDARAPAAVLRIGDATRPDGTCPDLPLAEQPLEVLRASRGRCVVLDASATTDPQDDEVSFRFRLVSPREEDLVETGPMVEIPESIRRAPDLAGVELVFEVRASDGHAYSKARATVTLTNSPPSVDVGSPRTLPLGGQPWTWATASSDFDVPFRALRATDPDGDPVSVCWTLPGEPENCADPAPILNVPSTIEATYSASARAFDGLLHSSPRRALVSVRAPNVWTHSDDPFESEEPMERLDARRRESTALGAQPLAQSGAFVAPGSVALQTTDIAGDEVVLVDAATDTIVASEPDAGNASGVGASEDGSRVWSIRECSDSDPDCPNFGTGSSRLFARTWTVPGLMAFQEFDVSNVPFDVADRDIVLSVTGDGAAWISLQLNESLEYVPAAGARVSLFAAPGRVFSSHGARPGSDHLWAVETPQGAGAPSAQIAVFAAGARIATIPLEIPVMYQIEWIDAGRFWTYVPGEGLRLVEADLIEAGVPLQLASVLAPRTFAPTLQGGPNLVGNPLTAECFAIGAGTGNGSGLTLARQDGSLDSTSSDSNDLFFVDPSGLLWFRPQASGTLTVGDSPSVEKVSRTVRASSFAPEYDHTTGGLWTPALIPGALVQIGEDGRILRNVFRTDAPGGSTELIEDPIVFALHPDGTAGWALSISFGSLSVTGLRRYDLASGSLDVVPSTLVLGSAGALAMVEAGVMLQPSAPVPGTTPFVWAKTRIGGNTTIVKIDADGGGANTPLFTLPVGEENLRFARSLRDNSLCIVSHLPATDGIVFRHLTAAGALTNVTTYAMAAGGQLRGVTTSSTLSEDLCWIVNDDRVLAVNPLTGMIVRSVTIGSDIRSLLAESRDEFWYTTDLPDFTTPRRRAVWNGASFDETQYGNLWRANVVPRTGGWFDF